MDRRSAAMDREPHGITKSVPRPQFSLKTLLWLMVVVGAFLGGMSLQWQLDRPARMVHLPSQHGDVDIMILRDGSEWVMRVPPDSSGAQE